MDNLDRKTLLCMQDAPPALTGIDFIQIEDHTIQTVLLVFFIVDPALLRDPDTNALRIPEAGVPEAIDDIGKLSITSHSSGENLDINDAVWDTQTIGDLTRTVLKVTVDEPGDFSLYDFTYDDEALDRFFATETFSFKQGCPSGLDCKDLGECPEEDKPDVAIDYMARDFTSIRGALLDFAAQHYPEWEARVEADQAMMLLEIMAAMGDEFAYLQDRYAHEAYLSTATQTQSIINLARLVDYDVDYGQSAVTTLAIGVSGVAQYTRPRTDLSITPPDRAYALRDGIGAIPFEIIEEVWVHPDWNEVPLYCADAGEPCLEHGATEAFLEIAPPDGSDPSTTPTGTVLALPADVWVGRKIILTSGLGEADEPNRAWAVTITAVEDYIDTLIDDTVTLARIEWDETEALPFQMPIKHSVAHFNCALAIAGKTVIETFRVGSDSDLETRFSGESAFHIEKMLLLPRAVEREGACENGTRGRILRFGLEASVDAGLAWNGKAGDAEPIMSVVDIVPDFTTPDQIAYTPAPSAQVWDFVEQIVDADAEDHAFTVEHGLWHEVLRYQKPSGDVVHHDYASNAGFNLRFGDRGFGIAPADAAILQATYLTAPGMDANLPANTVTYLAEPGVTGAIATMDYAEWVINPFPITSAKAPETVDNIRLNAPQAYQALTLRAVRNQDYKDILERRETLQQADANTRWTGSWSTDFIAVDPKGTTHLSDQLRLSLEQELDCIRQAGRSVCLKDPDYIAIDIIVDVCLEPMVSNSDMVRKITKQLASKSNTDAFFHPDNISFGQALIRSELEATIQCVDGVRAVEAIQIRKRGSHDFVPMEPRVELASHQIFQLTNDPAHPEHGYVEVSPHGGG